MIKKKSILLCVTTLLVLAGCGKLEKGTSSVSPSQAASAKTVLSGPADDNSYQALLVDGKYKTGKARNVTANLVNSNYNLANFEKGLLELSKTQFSTADYLFQEGQLLSREDILNLIKPQSDGTPQGLNVAGSPVVFQQVIEQNYLNRQSEQLAGISLGIALNKVDYSGEQPIEIDDDIIESEGKRVAAGVLAKIRSMKDMENIPVRIGLFKQARRDDIAGGHYFATSSSNSGNQLEEWAAVNEEHLVLPVSEGEKNSATQDGLANKYADFKNNVQSFFPNSSGISGVANYRNNELVKLTIVIETKYFSETEIINFTQFIGSTVETIFNINANIEVQINTLDAPQGFVKKQQGSDKVETHVFN